MAPNGSSNAVITTIHQNTVCHCFPQVTISARIGDGSRGIILDFSSPLLYPGFKHADLPVDRTTFL
jgi:hypothetical protein